MVQPVHGRKWWAAALGLVAALGGPVAAAPPASAETTLQVDAGYAGGFVPGRPVPVRVAVSADRLLRGSLEVAVGSAGTGVPVSMNVEVPGGSEKRFLVVAGTAFEAAPPVTVRLWQDGKVVATTSAQVRLTADQELVGLLPGVMRGKGVPGPAALAVDAGTARFSAVGEAELAEAPRSLGPLSTLGVDADELAGLSAAARQGVLAWVQDGGRLLVDAARGANVPGLPDAWQPGRTGRAAAGQGEVVLTDGAMAAGRWANLIEPTGRSDAAANSFLGGSPVTGTLASEAGLRSPRVHWLVGFLVAYVVAVGPLVFLVVRRRHRPELAWVAVPLVALLFSTGSYVAGRNLRQATKLVHASVVISGAAGGVATSYLGIYSPGGHTTRVGFPDGWSAVPSSDQAFAPSNVTAVTAGPDGAEARIPLDAGEFTTIAATGPAPADVGLEVAASTDSVGRARGTVRNVSQFAVDQVAVFAGSDGILVGTLAPGEQKDWTVGNGAAIGFGDAAFRVWPHTSDAWDPALWQTVTVGAGASFSAPGAVLAAGWTRDFAPAIRVDGGSAHPQGRTLVLARTQVRLGAPGDPLDLAVRQEVVRDPFNNRFGNAGPPTGSVVRFVLPADAATSGLVLRSPFPGGELWIDGAWRAAACVDACGGGAVAGAAPLIVCPNNAPCPPVLQTLPVRPGVAPAGGGLQVPQAAVRDGVVYARLPGSAPAKQGMQVTLGRST